MVSESLGEGLNVGSVGLRNCCFIVSRSREVLPRSSLILGNRCTSSLTDTSKVQMMYRKFLFPGSLENGADVTFLQQQGMIFFYGTSLLASKKLLKII